MATPASTECLELHTGQKMPILGFGTWHHGPKREIIDGIKLAVRNGVRHIDGAHIYLNEVEVGEAYKELFDEGVVKREDLFITSKLWSTHHEPNRVEEGFMASLKKLGLKYLDLYYIHWPSAFKWSGEENLPKDDDGRILQIDVDYVDTWKAMEKLVDRGLVKALGICNFNTAQMDRLFRAAKIKPAVLQVESNPRIHNDVLRSYCSKNGMAMIGYSSFGSPDLPWGEKLPHLLQDPVLKKLADKHGKSVAQVILRWQVQRKVGIIPKSIIESEILSNVSIFDFELDSTDTAAIATLDRNIRLIVPIVVLKDGTVEKRDQHSKYFPFRQEETAA